MVLVIGRIYQSGKYSTDDFITERISNLTEAPWIKLKIT